MLKKNRSSNIAVTNLTDAQKKQYYNMNNLHYFKQIKNLNEMREVKAKNIAYRNHVLQRQKIANYQNEKDRVIGLMSMTVTGGVSHNILNKRKQELNEMIKNIN